MSKSLPLALADWQRKEPALLRFFSSLSEPEAKRLQEEIAQLDLPLLLEQKRLFSSTAPPSLQTIEPFTDYAFCGNTECQRWGQALIKQGRMGCVVLAGGLGTRLRHLGPKGTYPISCIENKSLFQLLAEKVKAASKWAGLPLKLAIMTSAENHQETLEFFRSHDSFGLPASSLAFFSQKSLPLLDLNGHLMLKTPSQIAKGGDGNGHWFLRFKESGLLDLWKRSGIEAINIILIDNPLADPYDSELLGFHQMHNYDITLKCTEKKEPEEKVGVLVKTGPPTSHRCRVIEYSELPQTLAHQRGEKGALRFCCANLSLFCFSLPFIEKLANSALLLPLHKAKKSVCFLDEEGEQKQPLEPNCWKFETFIFDLLLHTEKIGALLYPRERCFAPLKNSEGADSPKTVQQALLENDRKIAAELTGLLPPRFPFELAADFYYPTEALRQKWRGREIPQESRTILP